MKFKLLLLVFIFIGNSLVANQNAKHYTDSINNLHDTSKVKHYLVKSVKLAWTDIKKSTDYAKKALQLAQKNNWEKGVAKSKFTLSRLFAEYEFELSEKLVLEALDYAISANDSNMIAAIYCEMGRLKANIDLYDEAKIYFVKSLDIFKVIDPDSSAAVLYNNLGIVFDMQYPDSFPNTYYVKSAEINKRTKNYLWLAMNYLNIGIDLYESEKYDEGYAYMQKSYQLANRNNLIRLFPWIYISYSEFYKLKNDLNTSLLYADSALKLSKEQVNLPQEIAALKFLHETYYEKGNQEKAYKYLQDYVVANDSLVNNNRLKEIDLFELKNKYNEELKIQQLDEALLEEQLNKERIMNLWLLTLSSAIILIFILFVIYQKNRIKRKNLEQKNTQLENEKISSELEHKNKELTTNVMYLLKKNEFISSVAEELKKLKNENQENQEQSIHNIIGELNKNIKDHNWEDFEVRFQQVHVDFYKELNQRYPNLSPNELRLCAFLRLNMTSKEIAEITFQSPESLKTARYRLRKKLGLDRSDNLVTFLTQF